MVESDSESLASKPFSPTTLIGNVAAAKTAFSAKTMREQQAVLSLEALSQQDGYSERVLGNQIADLTDKLILGAGEEVVRLVGREEREQLEELQRLITRRLIILQGDRNMSVKNETTGGSARIMVNGDGNGNGNGGGLLSGAGMWKSKSKSNSNSRERRGVSRGRK